MDKALQQLLESSVLSDDVKASLTEAWSLKLAEARQQIEEETRKDFAARYAHDKAQMVAAVDATLSEALKAELSEFVAERKEAKELAAKELSEAKSALAAQREKLAEAVTVAKRTYREKLAEHTSKIQAFVVEQLKRELAEFAQDSKALAEERRTLAQQVRESKEAYKNEYAKRIAAFEKFAVNQLSEEIREFAEDKRLLAEDRIALKTESAKQLAEAKAAFVKKAARLVESTAQKALRAELTQLKDDLEIARKNNFGRRIFEAFSAEYLASQLVDSSPLRKYKETAETLQAQLEESKNLIAEQNKLLAESAQKIKLVESKAKRESTLNSLLQPLSSEQRTVMAGLLENVRTDKLQSTFQRYLPTVLNEKAVTNKQSLTEASIEVTGDRTAPRMVEGVEDTRQETVAEIIQLRRLAGLE